MIDRRRHNLRSDLEALKKKAEGVFEPRKHRSGAPPDGPRQPAAPGTGVGDEATGRDMPAGMKKPGRAPLHQPFVPGRRPPGTLDDLVTGEEVAAGGESFYRVLKEAELVWERTATFFPEYLEALSNPFTPGEGVLRPLRILTETVPEEICYLDIETTGLRMCPLFLVGLMYPSGGKLVIDQLMARDYTEEAAVLRFLGGVLTRFTVLVTFNGLTFDIPFIMDRIKYSGLELSLPAHHVDLLTVARRTIGDRTPNHRLQTLERFVLNRKRIGDVPGSEIPGVYHEFVRTGDAGDIAGVIHHNRLDLVSMLQLVTLFLSGRG